MTPMMIRGEPEATNPKRLYVIEHKPNNRRVAYRNREDVDDFLAFLDPHYRANCDLLLASLWR